MIRNGILCAKVLALTAGLFLLNGCLLEGVDYDTVGGGSSVRGASVSDAMKASASGGGSVAGSSSHDAGTIVWRDNNDSAVGGGVAVSGGAALGDYYSEKKFAVEYDDRKYLWQVPLAVSYAVPFHGPIDSLTRFSLTLVTLETEHHYFGVFFGGDIVGMKSGSLAALGTDHNWMFECGFDYRYYFVSTRRAVNPYVIAGIGIQGLYWDYRSPIIVGSDVIHSDDVSGGNGYVGFGVAVKRSSRVSFFGEVGLGGMIFNDRTTKGFRNDVFTDFGYFNVKVGMTFKF